ETYLNLKKRKVDLVPGTSWVSPERWNQNWERLVQVGFAVMLELVSGTTLGF
ncbi:25276_t:CDS:2, partial [Gigaspora rosea]